MDTIEFRTVLKQTFPFNFKEFFIVLFFLIFLYLTSLISYNLFHILIELFCIIIAVGIFIVAWNAKQFFSNHYLLFLSFGFLFVASLDLAHLLSFNGLGIFDYINSTSNLSNQFWVAARLLQGLFIVVAPIYLNRKMRINLNFQIFFLITLCLFVSILFLKIFPTMYVEDIGLTVAKTISEYIISFILGLAAVFLIFRRKYLERDIFNYILTSIILTIFSEIAFTRYFAVWDSANLIGHFLRIISFTLIYKVIVRTGVRNPLTYIFRSLEQKNEIVKESEMKFKSLIYVAPSAVILTNQEGVIILWNQSAENIFGWQATEMLGQRLDKICPTVKIKGNKYKIESLITDRDPESLRKSVESYGQRKNGEIFPLDISSFSYKVSNQDYFCYIIRDISIRVNAKKELLRRKIRLEKVVKDLKIYKLALDNAFAHIVITDANGSIVYANKSTESITGYSMKEIMGQTPALWGRQMAPDFYQNLWKTIKEDKKVFAGEIINRKKNGEKYPAEIRVSPVLDNNGLIEFFVCLERDISETKAVEKAKTEFISLAAHQLKTPLTTISLASELLMKNNSNNLSNDGKDFLKTILNEVKDMTKLIEIFLNVSRVEMGKFPIENKKISLSDLLNKTVRKTLPMLKNKKITLKKHYPNNLPILNLDKKIINIILENLLSNAIKYSFANSEINLSVKKEADKIIIMVGDMGIGIPDHEQSKIFTKMFRADNVNKIKTDGSGLGLYLVKNLAKQSGYQISFMSREKEGTTFSLAIPISNDNLNKKFVNISNS